MITVPSLTLNNGVEMPVLGLGVWRTRGRECRQAVEWALDAGYRLVDTARIYGNEREVGEALRASGIPREQLFVTTKLWNQDQGHERALRAFDRSLLELGLDYVDLYLIHWPVPGARDESWRALQDIYREGRARAIGVSNYTESHLAGLLAWAEVVPAVDQVEFSPFLSQRGLRVYATPHGVRLEAYSPLTRGRRLGDPAVGEVARRLGRTPAQVLLRWALQHQVAVVFKSVHRERILENGGAFDFVIPAEDMRLLDNLDHGSHEAWDPTDVG